MLSLFTGSECWAWRALPMPGKPAAMEPYLSSFFVIFFWRLDLAG